MSMFNLDTFLETPTTESNATTIKAFPAGEYTAIVEDVAKPRQIVSNRTGETSIVMDVSFKAVDVPPAIAKETGRTTFTIRKGYFLDISSSGGLDMSEGKNVDLGRLRAALGQNEKGKAWMPGHMKGAGPIKIIVGLRPDKNNSDVVYNEVKSVGKL